MEKQMWLYSLFMVASALHEANEGVPSRWPEDVHYQGRMERNHPAVKDI